MVTYPIDWKEIRLEEALTYTQPTNNIENNHVKHGAVPVLTAGKSFILGYSNNQESAYKNLPAILFDDFTTEVRYLDYPFMVKSSATKFLNTKTDKYDIKFLFYWLNHLNYPIEAHERHWIRRFSKFTPTLPPLPEQQDIASVLSDFDELIDNLTELIEKKRAIRDGALEDLISGKTRLDSFNGEWESHIINDFIKIKRGASPRPIESYLTNNSKGINWIKIGDAPRYGKYIESTKERITPSGANHSVMVFPDDFLLSNSMSFGRPYILKTKGCIHDGWLRLYDFQEKADKDFLFYLLSTQNVQEQYIEAASGSGVQNLNKEVVGEVKVVLPPLPEQQAIAQVLSAMDEEIESLEKEKAKLEGISEGAMDDLLTGRVRLKV